MALSPAFLDELRARTQLSALVGKGLKLERAGREWRACCPFHDEKTPSFYVNDDKGFYHCFGCSAHGDAIRWLTDRQGLPFIDAVKELAAAAGLDMPAPDPQAVARAERAQSLHDVMAGAQVWFAAQLDTDTGADARDYLHKRGIDEAAVARFGIGFAPDTRTGLRTALARYGDAALLEAGLLIAVDDKPLYDRFRGRLMIPIRDVRGRAIAFGGRTLGDGEPKYLNSPDTPLFDKGRTLYNIDHASKAARGAGRVIVVEGYLDVIALAGAGIDEVVAPLGTALTEAHLARCWRLADEPVLCFDGDNAGRKAAVRAALRALPLLEPGKSLRFAALPAGMDPDDLVRTQGRGVVDALVDAAFPLVDLVWQAEHDTRPLTTPEAQAGLRQRLDAHVAAIADPGIRQLYARALRDRFDAAFLPTRKPFVPQARGSRPATRPGARPWSSPPPPASHGARRISSDGVVFERAVLLGVYRHPDVLADIVEPLGQLRIGDRALAAMRDHIVDAVYERGSIEQSDIDAICDRAGLHVLLATLRATEGLDFSFARSDADVQAARGDLCTLVRTLARQPQLDAALAEATAQASAGDEDGWLEQRRLTALVAQGDQVLLALNGFDDGI